MRYKKKWIQPELQSLNLMKTRSDSNLTTSSGVNVEFNTDYTPPIDLANAPQSGGGSSSDSEPSTYCFSTES